MIPTIAYRSFSGSHALAFPPKLHTEIIMVRNPKTGLLEEKKIKVYDADKDHYLPSRDDRRICVRALNWAGGLAANSRDWFMSEAQLKGCTAFVSTESTAEYDSNHDREGHLNVWLQRQYSGLTPRYSVQDMAWGFQHNFAAFEPMLADGADRGDAHDMAIQPYVFCSDGSSGTDGALLKLLLTASAYTSPELLAEIIRLNLYPAYLRAILANNWTADGIMNPLAHQPAYDVNEPDGIETDMPTRTRLIRMGNWCKARTAPPEVMQISLVAAQLPPHSVVTPSFVGGALPENDSTSWKLETIGTPLIIGGNVGYDFGGVMWTANATRSEFAVAKDGCTPAYCSFWNARQL